MRAASLPSLGDALDFLRLIWAVDHALQRTSKRMGSTMGVTGPQRLVIRIVGRFPGVTAGQLAKLLLVHPGTLTGVLGRLERRGLIDRRPDPRDRRRVLLGLTDKGRVFELEAERPVEGAVQRALEGVSPEALQATRRLLESLTENLSAGGRGSP